MGWVLFLKRWKYIGLRLYVIPVSLEGGCKCCRQPHFSNSLGRKLKLSFEIKEGELSIPLLNLIILWTTAHRNSRIDGAPSWPSSLCQWRRWRKFWELRQVREWLRLTVIERSGGRWWRYKWWGWRTCGLPRHPTLWTISCREVSCCFLPRWGAIYLYSKISHYFFILFAHPPRH